jgi:hypothetical protein
VSDYQQWADDTAYRMRDYYEANRPIRWWQKRNPPGSWGCIADDLMLGLLNIVLNSRAQYDADDRVLEPWNLGAHQPTTSEEKGSRAPDQPVGHA